MRNKVLSAYIICKNALLANGYAEDSARRLANRFSANGASVEKSINKLNDYLKQ